VARPEEAKVSPVERREFGFVQPLDDREDGGVDEPDVGEQGDQCASPAGLDTSLPRPGNRLSGLPVAIAPHGLSRAWLGAKARSGAVRPGRRVDGDGGALGRGTIEAGQEERTVRRPRRVDEVLARCEVR